MIHPFRKYRWSMLVAAGLLSTSVQANDDWWFDIEVILFDRSVSLTELAEQFDYAPTLAQTAADLDVIGAQLAPDISWIKQNLAKCDGSHAPLWTPTPSLEDIVAQHQQWLAMQEPQAELATEDVMPATDIVADNNSELQAEDVTDNPLPTDVPTVSAEEIAQYWVSFSGINTIAPVTVPPFSYCETPAPWLSWNNGQWHVDVPDNRLPVLREIPINVLGNDWPEARYAHVLSGEQHELDKLAQQIRYTKGLQRMLHLTWRQQVKFGEDASPSVHLYAGKNYSFDFDEQGEAIKPVIPVAPVPELDRDQEEQELTLSQDTFFSQLEAAINDAEPVSFANMMAAVNQAQQPSPLMRQSEDNDLRAPIWQLDGNLRVYLKYINRVPYLHIDSEMYYRQPVPVNPGASLSEGEAPEYKLVSVPFKQVRRVISKQIHYFDHPLFGMIVQIRRYNMPELPEPPEAQ